MDDDDSEHELADRARAPISKRKAPDESPARKPRKLPRLNSNVRIGPGRQSSSSPSSSPSTSNAGPASRTQPSPRKKNGVQTTSERPRAPRTQETRNLSASSGVSTSDFPPSISQLVQKAIARDKEKEREKAREQVGETSRHKPQPTARKRTVGSKNVRKVTTESLLRNAQTANGPRDESAAWTRVHRKAKQKRTSYDEEIARVRPLNIARQRDGDLIELTDSSDSTRRLPPSQRTGAGPRSIVAANKDDPIIITSSSEDDPPAISATQRPRGTQGRGANRKGMPPPVNVEVISISDSEEEDLGARPGPSSRPMVSAATSGIPSQEAPTTAPSLAPSRPATLPQPTIEPTSIPEPSPSTSTYPSEPETRQDDEVRSRETSPSYGHPPDDFDDPFGMDFDSPGDGANPGGASDGWDGLDAGPPLATLPVASSSGTAAAVGTKTTTGTSMSWAEGTEDTPESDALFDSYVNMDQLAGDMDQEGGGEELEERMGDAQGASTAGANDNPNVDMNEDVRMPELEEGELGPDDVPQESGEVRSQDPKKVPLFFGSQESGEIRSQDSSDSERVPLFLGTQESGEIRIQDSNGSERVPLFLGTQESGEIRSQDTSDSEREGVQKESQPPGPVAQPISPASPASASSTTPAKGTSQPLERTGALVMPDISSYKGIRFKRPSLDTRENAFFSRALNGAPRTVSLNTSERNDESESGSTPTDVHSNPGEVSNQSRDADMQDDAAAPMPEPSPMAAIPTSPPLPPPSAEMSMVADRSSTEQVQLSTVESRTIDNPPPSTQPTIPSIQARFSPPPATQPLTRSSRFQPTPSRPPSATQPLTRSSSRPIIAPPRVPRPNRPHMSLADVINRVRMVKLIEDEERELARRKNMVGATAEHSTPSRNAKPGSMEPPTPSTPSASQSPVPSSSSLTRGVANPMSLRGRRAMSNLNGGRRSVRSTPTRAPSRTSNDDEEGPAPTEPTAILPTTPTDMSNKDSRAPVTPVVPPTPMNTFDDGDGEVPVEPTTVPLTTSTNTTNSNHQTPVEPAPMSLTTPTDPPNGDEDSHMPPELVAVPMPAPMQVPTSADRNAKSASTTTTRSTPSSTTPSSAGARRRMTAPIVPFQAFISPVHARGPRVNWQGHEDDVTSKSGSKGKGKEIVQTTDPFVTPTLVRSRASMGAASASPCFLGSQKPKGRASWHARRESVSTAFEAFIVRDSPKQVLGTRSDTGTGVHGDTRPVEVLPPQPGQVGVSAVSESLSSLSVTSPVIPDAIPAPAEDDSAPPPVLPDVVPTAGGGGSPVLSNAVPASIGTSVSDSDEQPETLGAPPEPSSEVDEHVETASEMDNSVHPNDQNELDEADPLLELASVHLSQPEAVTEEEVSETSAEVMDVVDDSESAGSLGVNGPETQARIDESGDAMMVDAPLEDIEMREVTETVPQIVLDHPEPANAAVATVAPTTDFANVSSVSTTPDLVFPIELPSTLEDPDAHRRHLSGETASIDECDALLRSPARRELEVGLIAHVGQPVGSAISSRTASSTVLAPPRVRPRLSESSSRQRSLSREASSVDQLDLLSRSASVADQARERPTPGYVNGYPIITWASYVAEQRERSPEYRLARDLPHSLQDWMNTLPGSFSNSDVGRRIFEAHIQEAMVNEPEAPAIEIFDNDIGDEVTPRWEFHYTNERWYGVGVPPQDQKNLQSCGCVGRCDPKSGTCACAQRQRKWVQPYIDGEIIPSTWAGSPFVYDHRGQLQRLECPIFECNRFCNCDEDCPNRVVQNGRKWPVHIVRTAHKGWGVSAGNKKIPKGTYIGIYAGELLTEQEGEERGRYYDLYGRTYLFSIDFHHLKLGMDDPDDWENLYVVDAYHAGNFTRFLNHSCDPNCKIFACYIDDADVDKPLLAVFTTREVEPWEELCFSYYGDIDEKREEIEASRFGEMEREHAVYARCRCEADNCIGRLFS